MWPCLVVEAPVDGELYLRIGQVVKRLDIKQLGSEPGYKGFGIAVLPGRTWLDEAAFRAGL